MVIKKIKTEWAYIAAPNAQGKYTVTLRPNAEQQEQIEELLSSTWEDEFGTKKQPAWFGSKKEDENGVRFVANRVSKYVKDGETIENTLPVYDIYAKELDSKEIPNIANGSIITVSINAFITEYQGKRGVSLGLNKVMLIDYTEYSGGDEFEAEAEYEIDDSDSMKPEGLV